MNYDDEKLPLLLETLTSNPRMSIRELSAKTGLRYTYVRRRINALCSRRVLSFSIMISTSVVGKDVAFVKIKGKNLDRAVYSLMHCNRVLVTSTANSSEVFMVIHGRNKHEIAAYIEYLKHKLGDVDEVVLEYSTLPEEAMIPIKNNYLKCDPPRSCEKCYLGSLQGDHWLKH